MIIVLIINMPQCDLFFVHSFIYSYFIKILKAFRFEIVPRDNFLGILETTEHPWHIQITNQPAELIQLFDLCPKTKKKSGLRFKLRINRGNRINKKINNKYILM